ncbi:hypothetical protein FEZ60_26815 [Rhodococcus sp. MS16]|uniref:hypothetical protein n=1 Tax=Rhodococcus sp. MS16 TaxID=2579941 RepID=UPI0015625FEF|nr:hypothetical protein [Rhodococcus sp. MS16]NRI69141.1 hypothetical protein [Rhodococcus sp. MS16]
MHAGTGDSVVNRFGENTWTIVISDRMRFGMSGSETGKFCTREDIEVSTFASRGVDGEVGLCSRVVGYGRRSTGLGGGPEF